MEEEVVESDKEMEKEERRRDMEGESEIRRTSLPSLRRTLSSTTNPFSSGERRSQIGSATTFVF